MSKSLYDRLAETDAGARALASARLRYEALAAIHRAMAESGVTQTEVAKRLGIRKSAVNQVLHGDGSMKMSTLAEYLHVLGYEVSLELVPAGTPRLRAIAEAESTVDLEVTEIASNQGSFMSVSVQFDAAPGRESHDEPGFDSLDWTPFTAKSSQESRC